MSGSPTRTIAARPGGKRMSRAPPISEPDRFSTPGWASIRVSPGSDSASPPSSRSEHRRRKMVRRTSSSRESGRAAGARRTTVANGAMSAMEQPVRTSGNTGPLGQPRGIGFVILLVIVTFGFYGWYWVFKTQEEMKQHTGEGLGGVLGLVIWILLGFISAFVIPSEVGSMYKKDGQEPPITGWTGLWLVPGGILIIPAIVWFVKVQGALNRYWEGKASGRAAAG